MTYVPPVTETNPPFTNPPTWPFASSSERWEADYRLRLLEAAAITQFNPGLSGTYNVKMFGAKGDGVTDDTVALNAAFTSAGMAKILFPPGTYRVTQALQYSNGQIWEGVGPGASIIYLSNDLWTNQNRAVNFITCASGPDGINHNTPFIMRNLALKGPSAPTLAQTTNKTIGLQSADHCYYEHLFISNFYVGIENRSNHECYFGVYCNQNYYNFQFSTLAATYGNQAFYSCKFDGPALASIHIEAGAQCTGAVFNQTHLGFGPVGIFKTDQQNGWDANGNPNYVGGATASATPISYCTFNTLACESVGNCAILDTSTLSQFCFRSKFNDITWSFNNTYKTTNAPLNNADWQQAWAINTRSWDGVACLSAMPNNLAAGSVGVFRITGNIAVGPTYEINGPPPAAFFGSGSTWSNVWQGMKFIINSNNTLSNGEAWSHFTNGTINVGDIVELVTGNQYYVQRAAGTKPAYGIALTASAGVANTPVAIQIRGIVPINAATASIAAGSALYMNATTPYTADTTSTAKPVVGMSFATGGSTSVLSMFNNPPA